MDAKQVWRAALGELQVSLSPANFETWLRDTYLVDVDDQRFRIAVPNGFAKDWLETRYRSLISQTLARVVGYSVQVEFVVQGATEVQAQAAAIEKQPVRVERQAVFALRIRQLLVGHQIQGELSICREPGKGLGRPHHRRIGEAAEGARHHQTDRVTAGPGQAFGSPVGDVVVLGGGLADSGPRGDRHFGTVPQRQRDTGFIHPQQVGQISNCDSWLGLQVASA